MIASIPDFTATPVAPKSGIANRELVGIANFPNILSGLGSGSQGSGLPAGEAKEVSGDRPTLPAEGLVPGISASGTEALPLLQSTPIEPGNLLPASGTRLPIGSRNAAIGGETGRPSANSDLPQSVVSSAQAESLAPHTAQSNAAQSNPISDAALNPSGKAGQNQAIAPRVDGAGSPTAALTNAVSTPPTGQTERPAPKNAEPMRTVKLGQGMAGADAARDFKAPPENVLTASRSGAADQEPDTNITRAQLPDQDRPRAIAPNQRAFTDAKNTDGQNTRAEFAGQPGVAASGPTSGAQSGQTPAQTPAQPPVPTNQQAQAGAQVQAPKAALDLLKADNGAQAKRMVAAGQNLAPVTPSGVDATPSRANGLVLEKRVAEADWSATQRLTPTAPATNPVQTSQADLEMPATSSSAQSMSQAGSPAQLSAQAQAIAPTGQAQPSASGIGALGDASNAQRLSAQLENTIEQLTETRSIAQANRPEFTLRHQEFGAITMRMDAMGGDLRATLFSRDPGFVPAIQSALAERSVAATSETAGTNAQRGQDQSASQGGSQSGSQSQSQNNAFAGSAGHGWHSEGRYGSSTGSGQGTSQPYSGQTDGADDETGSEALASVLNSGLGKNGEGERFA